MKLNTIVIAAALALAGSVASAATVGTFKDAVTGDVVTDPEIGPGVYSIFEASGTGSTAAAATFDYVYNFTLDASSNLNVTGNTYVGPTVSTDSANFMLYTGTSAGTSGSALTAVPGGFSFLGTAIQSSTYTNLAAGNYFIELTGSSSSTVGNAFNVTFQAPSAIGPGGTPAIPEPTNMALLLAGLGLMGFMVKRRSSN
jgi:hypothetical protein